MKRREEVEFCFGLNRTDKLTHGYAMIYEKVSRYIRNIFEIGISEGNSIRSWLNLFPYASIWALDVNESKIDDPRVTVLTDDVKSFVPHPSLPRFDLIVDDGSHNAEDIIAGWNVLSPICKGLYVIEDLSLESFTPVIDVVRKSSNVNSFLQTSHGGGSRALVASFDTVITW